MLASGGDCASLLGADGRESGMTARLVDARAPTRQSIVHRFDGRHPKVDLSTMQCGNQAGSAGVAAAAAHKA